MACCWLLCILYFIILLNYFFFRSLREHAKYLQINCEKLIHVHIIHKYSAHGVFANDVVIIFLHMLAIAFACAGDLPQWLLLFTATYINIACVLTKLITVVIWKQMPCQWTPISYFSNAAERICLVDPKKCPLFYTIPA